MTTPDRPAPVEITGLYDARDTLMIRPYRDTAGEDVVSIRLDAESGPVIFLDRDGIRAAIAALTAALL